MKWNIMDGREGGREGWMDGAFIRFAESHSEDLHI